MGIVKDVPLLLGITLILGAVVFSVANLGLPGIGDIQNPVDEIRSDPGNGEKDSLYKVTTQINIGSTALGDTEVNGFTYQTQESCNFCLSIADESALSIGGSNNVKADVRVVNQDTGKVYVQTTKFLGDLGPGETKEVNVDWENAPEGTYLVRYIVTYDPDIFDPTDGDNVKRERFNIDVPKGGATT